MRGIRSQVARVALAAAIAVVAAGGAARAETIEGHVYIDVDGDGLVSAPDQPAAGLRVAWETEMFAVTDANGAFTLEAPVAGGIVWARTTDDLAPGPAWRPAAPTVEILVSPARHQGPIVFAQASDTHMGRDKWDQEGSLDRTDLERALVEVEAAEPQPHFVVITGDIAQSNNPDQFVEALAAFAEADVPFVTVPGNHDWFDGGASYRAALGPPMYSFDAGGVRFLVLNDLGSSAEILAFIEEDLADLEPGRPVIAFSHMPAEQSELDAYAAAGVDDLFTGHWHSNLVLSRDGIREFTTEPFIRGGLDLTPAGYRLVWSDGSEIHVEHRTYVEQRVFALVYPLAGDCLPGGAARLIVDAEDGGGGITVTGRLDGADVSFAPAGGWTHVADVADLTAGDHSLHLQMRRRGEVVAEADAPVRVGDCAPAPVTTGDWPQHQGDALHQGFSARAIAPPLATRWATAVGGHVLGGAPAVAAGRVFIPVSDLADGESGGVVALDLATGAELWRATSGASVRSTPAVAGDVVVTAETTGVVRGWRAGTGEPLWSYDLGAGLQANHRVLYAPPAIADGVVYVGVQRHFAALAVDSGTPLWEAAPNPDAETLGSLAAVAVTQGTVVGGFGRGQKGLVAWDADSGGERWRLGAAESVAVQGAPVVADDVVYYGNGQTRIAAVQLATGDEIWSNELEADHTSWDYGLQATPAFADGRLFWPSAYGPLRAIDAATGDVLWRADGDVGVVHATHVRSASAAFVAAPVVTGDIVWAGGIDASLRAFAAADGCLLWQASLAAPLMSAPVPAGDLLVVATFDGTVRAMDGAGQTVCPMPPPGGGDGCALQRPRSRGRLGSAGALVALGALLLAVRRRGVRAPG